MTQLLEGKNATIYGAGGGSGSAKGTLPGMGSTGPADAATEAFVNATCGMVPG